MQLDNNPKNKQTSKCTSVCRCFKWPSSDKLPLKVNVGRAKPDTPCNRSSCSWLSLENLPKSSLVLLTLAMNTERCIICSNSDWRPHNSFWTDFKYSTLKFCVSLEISSTRQQKYTMLYRDHWHIECFRPEWYISTIHHAWDTPFWSGTLDIC